MGRPGFRRLLGVKFGIFPAVLVLLTQVAAAQTPSRSAPGPEVRRMGLSKVGENTLLTMVLDRRAEPRVLSRTVSGKPQLVVEFPQARAGRLPARLEGDELLVEQVGTENLPGGGVRIVLDLYPDQPYLFWRQSRPGSAGQTIFMLGVKADPAAPPKVAQMRPPEIPDSSLNPGSGESELWKKEGELVAPPPAPERESEPYRGLPPPSAAPGSFSELKHLMPKAGALLQGLETDGWRVSEAHNYDRPGQRFSRDFLLSNPRYPELAVKVVYLPANTPNTPNIGIISLAIENLNSEAAGRYRNMRQWSFSRIKQEYEDIGDFFEDALKPLRVKLREETQTLALRYAPVLENFVKRACQDPKVAERVMGYIKEKVNKRFEGVQYTVCENPLVLLNLVDFLYIKVYYVDPR
jgi:hypothetical protein